MPDTRKNHLTIDGGQVKEDDHVSSYKPIPESDKDFRTSKSSITKSKEKLSSDGAEEKLLQKEEEAKIITRVDMADAKYVVGDHRNGDAKIELDANKRQFSGLTKEELMKYAEDPFWVRLRWFMFILFWALWLCMLAGAVAIIIRAPKCYPPKPRTWYEKGPLVDMSSAVDYKAIEEELPIMKESKVAGVFSYVCKDTYIVLDDKPGCIEEFKAFAVKAKDAGVKVVVDLVASCVSTTHRWFTLSENRTQGFADYFIWAKENTSLSQLQSPGGNWGWSEKRGEFYLQSDDKQSILNFNNTEVVKKFDAVIKTWIDAGAYGFRLHSVSDFVKYESYALAGSNDTDLNTLLTRWANLASGADDETVFTLAEKAGGENYEELFLEKRNTSALRPPSAVPIQVYSAEVAKAIDKRLPSWPLLQEGKQADGFPDGKKFMPPRDTKGGNGALPTGSRDVRPRAKLKESEGVDVELAKFALLLPAAPVLALDQLQTLQLAENDTKQMEVFKQLVSLRNDASIQHGNYSVFAAPSNNSTQTLLACARWKESHTGYAGVYNPGDELVYANLTGLSVLPSTLTPFNTNTQVDTDKVPVEGKSTFLGSYVPNTAVKE